jgi:hypothetical protein
VLSLQQLAAAVDKVTVEVGIGDETEAAITDYVKRRFGTVTQALVNGQLEAAVWDYLARNDRRVTKIKATRETIPIRKSGWAYMKERFPNSAAVDVQLKLKGQSESYRRVLESLRNYWKAREN